MAMTTTTRYPCPSLYDAVALVAMRMMVWMMGLMLVLIAAAEARVPLTYPVDEYWFDAMVDHYNFRNPRTFPLRYFVNDKHGQNAQRRRGTALNDTNSPSAVLFYAGNEDDILQFVQHSGFLFEAAEELGAMVVFTEHRYYGQSFPDHYDLEFLTVEQAMADFNTLTVHIRQTWNLTRDAAFIALGGSYGGNLALWLRLKNPNLWAGAIASSATPLKHVLRETNDFAHIETEVYANVSAQCPNLVREGWEELYGFSDSGAGRVIILYELGLCDTSAVHNKHDDNLFPDTIYGWIGNALETMVQYGYPYPTDFYNPVPAYPFAVACHGMLQARSGLGALRAAVDVYYNYTGQAGDCYAYDDDSFLTASIRHWQRKGDAHRVNKIRQQGSLVAVSSERLYRQEEDSRPCHRVQSVVQLPRLTVGEAWGYQLCTEVFQPMPTDGITDFELPYTPNQTEYFAYCWEQYSVKPRPHWEELVFMGSHITSGSNIFLTSGQLDPWRAAGITTLPAAAPASITIRIIEQGAHHLDLRASHPADPPWVTAVREEELAAMREWIQEWRQLVVATSGS